MKLKLKLNNHWYYANILTVMLALGQVINKKVTINEEGHIKNMYIMTKQCNNNYVQHHG